MTKAFAIVLSAMALAAAPQALAQEAAPVDQAAPASSFSDADIQAYAGAAVQINKIQGDASLSEADKQTQMAGAVQKSGLDPAKFNAITEASKTDPVLKQKLQEAVRQ